MSTQWVLHVQYSTVLLVLTLLHLSVVTSICHHTHMHVLYPNPTGILRGAGFKGAAETKRPLHLNAAPPFELGLGRLDNAHSNIAAPSDSSLLIYFQPDWRSAKAAD